MILISDAKYIHPLPIFLTSSSVFILQVWTIHKFIRMSFISVSMLIKLFVSNIIIDIRHNLNKYMAYI